jgi:hypothetical protein
MTRETLQAVLEEALREGLSLEDIIATSKDAWVQLNENEASEAVVVTYIIEEPEYLTLEEAQEKVFAGEIKPCDTHGLHLNEEDHFFHWKYKAYHLERAPNERERAHMLAKMMGVTMSTDSDEYE